MKVIAFTGAGISKSAGIPTFEEVIGLKEKLSVEFKNEYPEEFKEAMTFLKDSVKDKQPTKAHKLLAELQIPIITMNIDGLHGKAGSKVVYEIHGSSLFDTVVLYGEDIQFREESINLIIQTAKKAELDGEESLLLVIGTSMQTVFANVLVWVAKKYGMHVRFINENADEKVPKFLLENLFLPRN